MMHVPCVAVKTILMFMLNPLLTKVQIGPLLKRRGEKENSILKKNASEIELIVKQVSELEDSLEKMNSISEDKIKLFEKNMETLALDLKNIDKEEAKVERRV